MGTFADTVRSLHRNRIEELERFNKEFERKLDLLMADEVKKYVDSLTSSVNARWGGVVSGPPPSPKTDQKPPGGFQ